MAIVGTKLHERERVHSATRQAPSRTTPLVLVVDDHADTRLMLNILLGIYGYNVVEAEDGMEAVNLVESVRPDLVLMDGNLPILDGIATTKRIRELATLNGVPIVFLSGHAEPSYRVEALSAGCNEFLVKPINFAQLKKLLSKYIDEKIFGERGTLTV
jgi:two-component system cell cycle response regulator DivK